VQDGSGCTEVGCSWWCGIRKFYVWHVHQTGAAKDAGMQRCLAESETETTTCVLGALFFFFHDFQQRVKLKENCQPGKAEWERRLFDGKVAGGVVAL